MHARREAEAYVRRAIATTSFNASARRRRFAERAHLYIRSREAPGAVVIAGEYIVAGLDGVVYTFTR